MIRLLFQRYWPVTIVLGVIVALCYALISHQHSYTVGLQEECTAMGACPWHTKARYISHMGGCTCVLVPMPDGGK